MWLTGSSAGQNLIQDDPDFNIDNFTLPDADLSRLEDLDAFIRKRAPPSQTSSKWSQLSPGERSIASGSSSHPSMVGFDFLGSAHSSQRFATPASFGRDAQKPLNERLALLPEDEGLAPVDTDLGFMVDAEGNMVDAEGNMIEIGEPELPPLFGDDMIMPMGQQQEQFTAGNQGNLNIIPSEGPVIMGEELLPDAEALDTQVRAENVQQNGDGTNAPPSVRRGRPRKAANFLDRGATFFSKNVIRDWCENYGQSSEDVSLQSLAVGWAKAKNNAFHFTFGTGIGNIGQEMGLPGVKHPLAEYFAGDTLRDSVFGVPGVEVPRSVTPESGRRRTASEAFDGEEEGRRVRQRSEDGEIIIPDADVPMEVGRDNQAVDPHSSIMPWSRQGSNVPGSAVKNAQRSRSASVTSLMQKGSVVPDIERFSDPHHPSDNFAAAAGGHSSSIGDIRSAHEDDSQWVRAEVEQAAQDFLAYAVDHAKMGGRVEGETGWVDFEELVVPGRDRKGAAAQGFYHVLSLATRGRVRVWQDGREAFGRIEVGVGVGDGLEGGF